jgi:putative transposase
MKLGASSAEVACSWYRRSGSKIDAGTCPDPACGVVKTKLRLSERTYRCDQCEFTLDRDLTAARNLAALVDEVIGGTSSQSCGATVNEPDGNLQQTHTVWAAGTATGRPTRSTPRRKATTV